MSDVRLGIVGCGLVMREKHMPVLPHIQGLKIVGIADSDPVQLARIANEFGFSCCFPSFEAMLEGIELDAVAVLTQVGEHHQIARSAIAAGKHVFVEKPLTLTVDEGIDLAQLAESADVCCMVGFHMRWHPQILQARRLLRQGALGTIECIQGTWSCDARRHALPAWRNHWDTGGGCLIELGVHLFDLWRFLGDAEVAEITAFSRSGQWPDESAVCQAVLQNGTLASAVITERSRQDIELAIFGTVGQLRIASLRYDGFQYESTITRPGDFGPTIRRAVRSLTEFPRGLANLPGGDYRASYRGQWRHFVACIDQKQRPTPAFQDGLEATRIAQAAVASAKTRQRVVVDRAPVAASP
ncbi:MAG: Gfo/Idh/MocA family protein [Planctomycetaceae bacterium]